LPPDALDTEETGPRQNRQMRRHRILGDLAASRDVTGADRVGVSGNEPAKCRHAGVLRQRGQGLDGGTLIDESRHADEIAETYRIHKKRRNFSTDRIENLGSVGQNLSILMEFVIQTSLYLSMYMDTILDFLNLRKAK
jgi:hypothetical protein